MTRPRLQGDDTPFGKWLREHEELDSVRWALNVTDSDYLFHKYKTNVDRVGMRDLQLAMLIEVKTHGSLPKETQLEILFYHHQLLSRKKKVQRLHRSDISLWHFGVYVLLLPGEAPDQHEYFYWGRFKANGTLGYARGTSQQLCSLLRFDFRPDDFKPLCSGSGLRRHHKTKEFLITEKMPLGFEIDRVIKFSS